MTNKQKLFKYINNCSSLKHEGNTVKTVYNPKTGVATLQGQCVECMIITPIDDGFVFSGLDEYGQDYSPITVYNLDGISTWVKSINHKYWRQKLASF